MDVKKESIKKLLFAPQDVLVDESTRAVRRSRLRKALVLGNLYKRKVRIQVQTVEGYAKHIEEAVWGLGEEYVSLETGDQIPIRSVSGIEFLS